MVDTHALGACTARCGGSSPLSPTRIVAVTNSEFPSHHTAGIDLDNVQEGIAQAVANLPIDLSQSAEQDLRGCSNALDVIGGTVAHNLQVKVGDSITKLGQATAALILAGQSLRQYAMNIGVEESGCRPGDPSSAFQGAVGVRESSAGRTSERTLPEHISLAFDAIQGLLDLPDDADYDTLLGQEDAVRDRAEAIVEALGREDTVDTTLSMLLGINDRSFAVAKKRDFHVGWDNLLTGWLGDCMVQIDKVDANGQPGRLEKVMRFVSEPGPWRAAGLKGAEIFKAHLGEAMDQGIDFVQFKFFLLYGENLGILLDIIKPPPIDLDNKQAKAIWAERCAVANQVMSYSGDYVDIAAERKFSDALDLLLIDSRRYFPRDMLRAIRQSSSNPGVPRERRRNSSLYASMFALGELESKYPGLGKRVYDRFGIRRFEKYTAQMLADQDAFAELAAEKIDNRPDKQRHQPWVMAAVSTDEDRTRAFDHRLEKFTRLRGQIEEAMGRQVPVCIYEFGSKRDLLRRMSQARLLARRVGPAVFGTLLSHGSDGSFLTGRGEAKLTRGDINQLHGRLVSGVIAEGAAILMDSCSTGTPGGIGEHIHEVSGRRVIGPKEPIIAPKLAFSYIDGRLGLSAEYKEGPDVLGDYGGTQPGVVIQ